MKITNYICTSHALAKELLSKPDGFLTATHDEKEYVILDYKRIPTHSNIDDGVMYWTLNLRRCDGNNIKV